MNNFFGILKKEFHGYNRSKFLKDLLSGLTVTAVALPLGLAFGVSCGATAAAGLITAIFAGIIIAGLGGSSFQISGSTGAMTAVILPVIAKYGFTGVLIAGFLSGIILIAIAILRIGKIVNIIPMPVIFGFTSGIAITIAAGQIDNFFGTVSKGSTLIEKIMSYGALGFHPNLNSVLIGILVIGIMIVYPKRFAKILPSSLVAIIAATFISAVFKLELHTIGKIPAQFILDNRLNWSALTFDNFKNLIVPAISIAALAMIETLLCGTAGSRMKKESIDPTQELIAQGIGNIIIPFFGGVPATAAIARTSVAIKSNGITRITSVIHSVCLIITMLVLAPVMSLIPLSALAGVLMVTSWHMNEWHSINTIFSKKFKGAIWKFTLTMLATVLFDLTTAIILGFALALILFFIKISDIDITISDILPDRLSDKNINCNNIGSTKVIYFTGTLFFGTAQKLASLLPTLLQAENVVISMRGVPMIDISGSLALIELIKSLKQENVNVVFSALQPKVEANLKRLKENDIINDKMIFWNTEQAIQYLSEQNC